MKFPRNARMLKGHLDFAPFASVFFCLLIFIQLSAVMYKPGVAVKLFPPSASPAASGPVVTVLLDASGGLYFENHYITDADLKLRLMEARQRYAPTPLTLEILADTNSLNGRRTQVLNLAQQVGITNYWEGLAPSVFHSTRK